MKKFKKVVALGIAGVMSVGLVGCGGDQAAETGTNDIAVEETAVAEADSEKAEGEGQTEEGKISAKYPAKDLGGRTFTFAYNWDAYPMTEPDPASATMEDIYKYDNLKRVEAKYNCKINYINVPYEEIAEKLTTSVMAGAPFADAVLLDAQQIIAPALNNQIIPLEDINLPEADIFNAQEVLYESGNVCGKNYGMKDKNEDVDGYFMGVNLDIINELGLENPVELYEKGEWTWDKFLEIAKAATKDTDGDGAIDQWGLSGVPLVLAKMFIASNDGYLTDDINIKEGLSDPKTMEALEFYSSLYNTEKVVYLADNNVWEWNGNLDAFKTGDSAMFQLQNWMLPTGDSALQYQYTIVPMPKGPSNDAGTTYITGQGGVVIPTGTENPEDVLMIFEEINDWYGDDYSIKADATLEWLETLYQTEEDIERALSIKDTEKIDITEGIADYPISTVVGNLIEDGQTVAQAVEANKQLAQDSIEAILKPAE